MFALLLAPRAKGDLSASESRHWISKTDPFRSFERSDLDLSNAALTCRSRLIDVWQV
jgi:hypothetical protein